MSPEYQNGLDEKLEKLIRNELSVDRLTDLTPLIERRVRIKVREVLWGDTTLKDAYDVLHLIYGRPVHNAEVNHGKRDRHAEQDPCERSEEES